MNHPLSRRLCKPVPGQKFTAKGVEYVLAGKLGDGAAALVRRVRRVSDRKEFAIKFLAPDPKYIDQAVFDDVAARFRREGQRAQQLSNENLVTVYAYDENVAGEAFLERHPTNPFILMEEVKGTTLESYIKRQERRQVEKHQREEFRLTSDRLSIAIHVTQALQYLHQKKLVHRDVKPANIFLPETATITQPRAKLGDFGIVKWGDFQASITTGTLTMTSQRGLGTLKYMSPEQAIAPKDVTVRSDIYSLGITLYELFTGHILPSPHHVFEIFNARLSRGTTESRLLALGYHVATEDVGVAEMVLDMHLRGPSGRPAIEKVVGRLEREWEMRTDEDWSVGE
jgi:eukaryotic-like serine/threonine-protein kinase